MPTKITTRFQELLKRPKLLVMAGGFSPLHARMSEVLGYEAFFMSGSQVAAYLYGYPDVGLLGLGEMVEAARRLAAGCNIPIFADAGAGYRALLWSAAVANVRGISGSRRRGGSIPEPHHRERPASDLGSAPRIQRTRSCRAR